MPDTLGDKLIDVLRGFQHRPGQVGDKRQGPAAFRIIGVAETMARIDRVFPGIEQREVGSSLALLAVPMHVRGKGTGLPIRADHAIGNNEMQLHPALILVQHPAIEALVIRQAGIDQFIKTIHDFLQGAVRDTGFRERQHSGGVFVGVTQAFIQLPHKFRIAAQYPRWHATPDAFPGLRVGHLKRQDIFDGAALGAVPEELKQHEAAPQVPLRWRAARPAPPESQPDWPVSPRYSKRVQSG